ncbi:MAG: paraquat-inducible protein A [Pseudomonadota bacterium]|nr:paraquat-inducible protein A [Pseudomonadota bacterium]
MSAPVNQETRGTQPRASIIVCPACDLAHRKSVPAGKARVRCVRCRAELYRTHGAGVDTPIAVALSALLLLVLGNLYPLVTLQLNGSYRATTLMGAVLGMYRQGYALLGVLVLLTTVVIPLFQILGLLYVLWPLRSRRRAPGHNELFRALTLLRPWAMSEVFMLGALVAMVKLAAMAQVIPGIALGAYGALMLALAALISVTPTEQFWQWMERTEA